MGGDVLGNVIYGDILFAVDFSMDFLSLYIVSKIMRVKPKAIDFVLAATAGAAYSAADFIIGGNRIVSLIIGIAVCLLMCFILFGFGIRCLRASLLLYAVSFLMGGGMTALYYFVSRLNGGRSFSLDGGTRVLYADITLPQLIIFAAICFAAAAGAGRLFISGKTMRKIKVCAKYDQKEIIFEALVDSGNLLCDPLGGRPVIILREGLLHKLLPDELKTIFRSRDLSGISDLPTSLSRRIRLLPCGSVGGERLLLGILPDLVTVGGVPSHACLAEGEGSSDFGGCDALLPSSLADL